MPVVRDKTEIDRLQKLVQGKLNARRPLTGKQLNVVNFVQDDEGWLDFVVSPAQAGVRAYDYAKALADVELELRTEGITEVLLVPAMPD